MLDPYIVIRRRCATFLCWAVSIAMAVFYVDALIALSRFPFFGANTAVIASFLMLAALCFAQVLRGNPQTPQQRMQRLLALGGGLFFYALIFRFAVFGLAQLALLFCLMTTLLDFSRLRIAATRSQVLFLAGSRLGVLLMFLIWQTMWNNIFIAPGMTILVNLIVTLIVIRQLGRIRDVMICMVASGAALAMAGVMTLAVPFVASSMAGRLEQIVVTGITLAGSAVVGFLLGAISHLVAEPLRKAQHAPQGDARAETENDLQRLVTRTGIDKESAGKTLSESPSDHSTTRRLAPEEVAELLRQVGDPDQPDIDGKLREAICRAAPQTVAQLVNALGSPNVAVREAAAYALREAGAAASEAIAPLRLALLDECPAVRQKAAGSLVRLGACDGETTKALEAAANDASLTVRLAVQKALRELEIVATRSQIHES